MNQSDILIDNFIETHMRGIGQTNEEYIALYSEIENQHLKKIFSTVHYRLIQLFNSLNTRIPKDDPTHFWAEDSRGLIWAIEIIEELHDELKKSRYSFTINQYYKDIFNQCKDFLSPSGGSSVPVGFKKVRIPYQIPIIKKGNSINVEVKGQKIPYPLKPIGNGSYANVFKFVDEFYGKAFAFKKAKGNLNQKEIERFKREYEITAQLKSPYIIEVYKYIESQNSYIMEFMDSTLDEYLKKNNSKMDFNVRKSLALQTLRAFEYIHSKGYLHRDISPKNILLKLYDDIIVVKVGDFGLVKIPDSTLTSKRTDFKGYFNDPNLQLTGFDSYDMTHETYAITRVLFYILTGKINVDGLANGSIKSFIQNGLNSDRGKRYRNIAEIRIALNVVFDSF